VRTPWLRRTWGADDAAIARSARAEGRVLVTLDFDFAKIQVHPPSTHSGIILLRMKRQDQQAVLGLVLRVISALKTRLPKGDLWIVEPDRIRFRTHWSRSASRPSVHHA